MTVKKIRDSSKTTEKVGLAFFVLCIISDYFMSDSSVSSLRMSPLMKSLQIVLYMGMFAVYVPGIISDIYGDTMAVAMFDLCEN